jgi:hypothetical protein
MLLRCTTDHAREFPQWGLNGTVNKRKHESLDKPKGIMLPLITPGHARAEHKEETIGGLSFSLALKGNPKPEKPLWICLQKDGNSVRVSVGFGME